jgi:hypothetical protein
MEECGPRPVFASFTLAFALQLRKKTRKNFSQGKKNVSHSKNLSHISYHIKANSRALPNTLNFHCLARFKSMFQFGHKFFCLLKVFSLIFLRLSRVLPKSFPHHSVITNCKVKVKVSLVQALKLCTGRTVHRGSRGIALLYRH